MWTKVNWFDWWSRHKVNEKRGVKDVEFVNAKKRWSPGEQTHFALTLDEHMACGSIKKELNQVQAERERERETSGFCVQAEGGCGSVTPFGDNLSLDGGGKVWGQQRQPTAGTHIVWGRALKWNRGRRMSCSTHTHPRHHMVPIHIHTHWALFLSTFNCDS